MRHKTWEEMKARGWNRAFHAAHGNTLIELLFLLVGMLVLSVSGAASAKKPSSEKLDFAATGRVKERIVATRAVVRVSSPSCEDSACRLTKQITVETRTEVRVASPSCVDSACRRTEHILSTGRRGPFFAGVRLALIAARTS